MALLFATPGGRAAEGDFAKTLTPGEIQSAGLSNQTPEERARLEALVERYRLGEVAQKAAESHAATPDKSTSLLPDWVRALVTLEHASSKSGAPEPIVSRLDRDFKGWTGRTVFHLENGQRWIQANSDTYIYSPALKTPRVKIYPASFGSFWLEIEEAHLRCRVKPLKLE